MTIALLFTSPSFAELGIKSDVIYGHKDGMALVYSVLQPENANGAAIVFMVSGGWFSSQSAIASVDDELPGFFKVQVGIKGKVADLSLSATK